MTLETCRRPVSRVSHNVKIYHRLPQIYKPSMAKERPLRNQVHHGELLQGNRQGISVRTSKHKASAGRD